MDYPGLVKYFASRNPLHLLVFVCPLWIVSLHFILKSDSNLIAMIFMASLGVIYWSFLEYAIHRWAYHTHFKSRIINYFLGSFHMYHHKDMSDRRVYNAGFLMIYFMTPTVLSPALLITQDVGLLAALTLGLTVSYYFYEWVHFSLHYKEYDSGYLAYIQKYHFHHHDKAPLKNFGNTSHLWDVILGTYDARYKNYVMPEQSKRSLITEKEKELVHA